ncbi:MAG TPA: HAMP domain-containing sensor histidine kinase [Solirubrobacteraceae bacterium]|nr:HAMP domain-containing sensor histidine kinase [Solirubrobacteraceae bacterium]
MRRRLLSSTGLIALVAVLVLGIPLGAVGSRLLAQRVEQRLEREADAAAVALERRRRQMGTISSEDVAAVAPAGHRLEVALPGGRRLAGGAAVGKDPVRVRGSGPLAVTVLAPRTERVEDTGGVWLAVIVLSLVAVAAAVVLALLQARRFAGPMERLARRADTVGHGDGPPAPHSGLAEVDRIGAALDAADRRIVELLRREREFSTNASHQLRGPLTGLRMRLEELAAIAGGDDERAEAEAALAQADRLQDVIEHLEALARGRDEPAERLDVAALAAEHVAREWAARFTAAGRALETSADGPVPARAGEETVRQLLDVLLENALRHGEGATAVVLASRGATARIVVRDSGPGIGAEEAERLFDRHFSTGGSGVGLAVAREIVRREGGELRLAGRRPAAFEAVLPA